MRALEFIRDHVTFKLPYDFSYQMKTPYFLLLKGKIGKAYFVELSLTVLNDFQKTSVAKVF